MNKRKKRIANNAPESLAAKVDTAGRLQKDVDAMIHRSQKMNSELSSLLGSEIPYFNGSEYVAIISKKPTYKLKKPASIHTLLVSLLARIDNEQASKGGLFDMILSLDNDIVNEHFVPLLRAVFDKAQVSPDAESLFLIGEHRSIEFTEKETEVNEQ